MKVWSSVGTSAVPAAVLAAMLVFGGPAAGPASAATGAVAPGMTLAETPALVEQAPAIRAMTDGEKAAAGCVISTVGTMGAVYAVGPSELIMLVVGGLIVPSNSATLFVSLMGTFASMACGAGALITPTVLWAWNQSGSAGGGVAQLSTSVKRAIAGLRGQDAQLAELPAKAASANAQSGNTQ